jgi:hypothetical protein
MHPPPKNAKAARGGGGLAEAIGKRKPVSFTPGNRKVQLPNLTSAHVDLDTLEVMAKWRHSLTCRIRRAQLRFELADCELPELHDLKREVGDYSKCVRALTWRPEASA